MREPVAWLSEFNLAMPAVIFTNIWRGIPFTIMILAGLQAIPDEVYEAATVDGQTILQRFWSVMRLPMLRPIIVVATATRIIWTFNYADLIFVMTGGGPANAAQITSTYTLMQAYSDLDWGYAAALSVVLLLIMFVFAACTSKSRRAWNRWRDGTAVWRLAGAVPGRPSDGRAWSWRRCLPWGLSSGSCWRP